MKELGAVKRLKEQADVAGGKKILASQKMRIIVDGVGIYTTWGQFNRGLFATTKHQEAVEDAISQMGSDSSVGIVIHHKGIPVQVDFL